MTDKELPVPVLRNRRDQVTFTRYDKTTGEIIGISRGPAAAREAYLAAGHGVVDGSYDRGAFRIVGGSPVPKSDNERKATRDEVAVGTIRGQVRNALSASDHLFLEDAPPPPKGTTLDQWKAYRAELRNLSEHPSWPDVDLPEPPSPAKR